MYPFPVGDEHNRPSVEAVRKNFDIELVVDLHLMLADGYEVYLDDSGDIVCYNDILFAYLLMVHDRRTGEIHYVRRYHVDIRGPTDWRSIQWNPNHTWEGHRAHNRQIRSSICVVCDESYATGVTRCPFCSTPVFYPEWLPSFKESQPTWHRNSLNGRIVDYDKEEVKVTKYALIGAVKAKRNRLWISNPENIPRCQESQAPNGTRANGNGE